MKLNLKTAKSSAVQFARRQKRLLRFRVINPGLFCIESALVRLYSGAASVRPVRVVLVSDGKESTSEEQFNPFSAYRAELRRELNLISAHLLLKDVLRAPGLLLRRFDVILLKLSFRTARDEVSRAVQKIRSAAAERPIIYYDGDDDLCVQWPELVPSVDLYVKKHLFRDKSHYLVPYKGKSNLTDYVSKQYGFSFADNIHATETHPLAPDQLDKLILGGNVALDSNIMELYSKLHEGRGDSSREVDVMFRGNVPKDWLYYLRKDIEPSLARLQESYNVITPQKRVTREEYYSEMMNSKICLSPFGFGEICWRDFEAIICGCMLVKPDMGHVDTLPNLFRPFETYVPVRWDYSDVYEQCSYYLKHADERERIAATAFDELKTFYENRQFLSVFSEILKRAQLVRSPLRS